LVVVGFFPRVTRVELRYSSQAQITPCISESSRDNPDRQRDPACDRRPTDFDPKQL
jgi:hypothetical protein